MGIIENIKILIERYKWVIIFGLLLPSFYTGASEYLGSLYGLIFYTALWPVTIVVFVLYFFVKKCKPSKLMIGFFVLHLWMIIEQLRVPSFTLDNYGNITRSFIIVAVIEMYVKDNLKDLLLALMLIFEITIYPDIISIIYNIWIMHCRVESTDMFLGYYNNVIVFLFPAICVGMLYIKEGGNRIRGLLLCIMSVVCAVISKASTPLGAMIGFIGVSVFLYIIWKYLHFEYIKLWPLFILAVIFNIFIVFVYREGIFPLLDSFIVNVLHRSTSFTGRVPIWNYAIDLIKQAPVLGYGYSPGIDLGYYVFPHSHNEYLNILLRFGAIGLILYFGFSFIYIRKIDNLKNSFYKIIFIGLIIGIQLAFVTDCVTRSYFYYVIYFLAYHFIDETANKA